MRMSSTLAEPRQNIRAKVPGSVHDDLILYGKIFEQANGHSIKIDDMVTEMLSDYMAADKDFQRRKKAMQSQKTEQPPTEKPTTTQTNGAKPHSVAGDKRGEYNPSRITR